jgi:hypothetical protein
MSNKPESWLSDRLHSSRTVNRPISLGIGPSQSQIKTLGHHWWCPTNLKADCRIDCTLRELLTDLFPWGSCLANHRSKRLDITGDVHQFYLPIGCHSKKEIITTSNLQSPLGFDLHQSECIIHGHHWWCPTSLPSNWLYLSPRNVRSFKLPISLSISPEPIRMHYMWASLEVSCEPASWLDCNLQIRRSVNWPISFGIKPSKSQIRKSGQNWRWYLMLPVKL